MSGNDILLTLLLALMALLYASVGHAGSSGYQASMAILGVSAEMMRPTALSLNIIVSLIATWQFARQGCIDGRRLKWLAFASVPAACLGGFLELPQGWYYLVLAAILWVAAVRLWITAVQAGISEAQVKQEQPEWLLLVAGGVLGLLSGLTGTGGGIFLTPLLVLCGWATPRQAAGLSAAFILANSPAALLGWWRKTQGTIVLPELLPLWMVLVAGFGWLGAWYGSRYGTPVILRRLLSLALVVAGAKMVLSVLK